MSKPNGIPWHVVQLLAEQDKRHGFPAGTMQSVMQQEVGGDFDKFLTDPTAYHYEPDARGKRIAKHTGRESTAFGPFGILESTGAKPGWGVKPLADKTFAEQTRFAADYLAARSKAAGSLAGGLAGYGEGKKYSQQVVSRAGGQPAPSPMPQQVASLPKEEQAPVVMPPEVLAYLNRQAPAPIQSQPEVDAWGAFLKTVPGQAQPINVADLDYANPVPAMRLPQFQYQQVANLKPDFNPFAALKGRA